MVGDKTEIETLLNKQKELPQSYILLLLSKNSQS